MFGNLVNWIPPESHLKMMKIQEEIKKIQRVLTSPKNQPVRVGPFFWDHYEKIKFLEIICKK